jgi:hypothetical protein
MHGQIADGKATYMLDYPESRNDVQLSMGYPGGELPFEIREERRRARRTEAEVRPRLSTGTSSFATTALPRSFKPLELGSKANRR